MMREKSTSGGALSGATTLAEKVAAGRQANLEARQKEKRSTRSNRLAEKRPFTSLTLSIPWKYLVADNAKYGVLRGRMLLRPQYRASKDTIQAIARRAMSDTQPCLAHVTLHAKLYVPDLRRRDATNYAKLIQDSLQGAVYTDDTQIKRATWEHCGIDRENPRCDVTITTQEAA
jgi:Holliday junction resolvase RusA-like endonuclease